MEACKASRWMLAFLLCAVLAGAATIPRHAPEFVLNTADGKQILLSQYNGKTIVFAFILTTCPHCQYTIGLLSKLQNDYRSRGVQVLACAIEDAARQNLPGFIDKFKPPFPVGYSSRDPVYEWVQHPAMLIMHMPTVLFIDKQRTIRAQYEGDAPFFEEHAQEKNFRDEIEKLLKGAAVTSQGGAHKARTAQAKK